VTTYVSSTAVTAAVPAAAITADGTAKIRATNPSPGGGTSAVQSLTITVPVAAMTSLSPQSVAQGSAATITITGSGFEANSVVQWNGSARPTTFVDGSTLKVALTAADMQNFGAGILAVLNPGLPPTRPLELTIVSSTPTILSISPNTVATYSGSNVPQQVYISGSGFAPNATVQANGQLVPIVSQNITSVVVTLSATYFASAGTINLVVSNPGSPAVSSNPAVLTVTGPTGPAFTLSPIAVPAGSPDTTITLNGTGFYQDSVVSWNKTPLATTYVSSSQVTTVIPAALLTGPVQASISVATPENTIQAAPQPFDTYLPLEVNDIVYNSVDGYIYASVPGAGGQNLGNTVAAIDPTTGVIQKTIFVGSQPNRLALSSDGTQLFVGLDGAGAVRQVDLTKDTAGVQFSLGGGPGVYNPPYTAAGLAAVPGAPNAVAVYATNGIVTIFDSGVARAKTSSGLSTYFVSNVGSLAFGSSASTLYVMSNAIGGYLYQLTVDSTGITASTQIGTGTGGNTLQYDNGRLYLPIGVVFSATTGAQLGQFSTSNSNSSSPTPAQGPIVSDSTLNRAWILVPNNFGASTDNLLAFDETTFNPVGAIPVTGLGTFGSGSSSNPADLIRWGQNGLAFHSANQLYILQGPIVKDTSGSPADVAVSVQAPATSTTGSSLTYSIQVQNMRPKPAQGINLTFILPESVIFNSAQTTQGSCSGSGVSYCDLGNLASGSSATVTVAVTPTLAGSLGLTASVSTVSFDPVSTNNQASGATTVTGSAFSPVPTVTQLVPNMVQAPDPSLSPWTAWVSTPHPPSPGTARPFPPPC
jgi:trimeric autotransporter adhesin